MISNNKVTEIFCFIDDFCKEMDKTIDQHAISSDSGVKKRNRKSKMSQSEVITILLLFHMMGYRCLTLKIHII